MSTNFPSASSSADGKPNKPIRRVESGPAVTQTVEWPAWLPKAAVASPKQLARRATGLEPAELDEKLELNDLLAKARPVPAHRTRTPRVTSDLGAGSTRVEKLKKRKDAPPATAAEDLAVGARVALGGAPGVLTAIEERGWYKVRLDGEETVRSARRTKLKLSKD